MARISFNPVEAVSKIEDGRPVIELYGPSGNAQVCVRVRDFQPYFWILDGGEIKDEKIVRTEEHEKRVLGKKTRAKKIFVRIPNDVPAVREKFDSLEADIPFTRRYLIDRKITPVLTYEAEGEYVSSDYKTSVFEARKIRHSGDGLPELKIMSVDVETDTKFGKNIVPGEDQIIMLAVYGKGLKKVLTWKRFKADSGYVEIADSERALIERFRKLVEEYKPDVITGYASDGFDLPYLKARAEKCGAKLNLGLDNSPIKISKGQRPVAEIAGIAHIDVLRLVRTMFKTTFISFKLDYVARELLNRGKKEVDLEKLHDAWTEGSDELGKFAEYNLIDAALAHDLCAMLLPNAIELTKLIGLTPADVSRMSFSQLVEWYLIKEAPGFNELVPNRPGYGKEQARKKESYEGGYVYEPTPGLYRDIAVFDFRSLYPTIISAHNVSPDAIIEGNGISGTRFSEKKGFISTVIDNVIQRRLQAKELARSSRDRTLEARQLALKTIANSIYGYYAFSGARWYSLECAKAITELGRKHVQDVIRKAGESGMKVIYSDTDSLFLALEGKKIDEAMDFVRKINEELPGIMELEFEGLYKSGVFVATKGTGSGAKKKYALMAQDNQMKVRGFEVVRRNLSPVAKETQEKVLRMILTGEAAEKAAECVKEIIRDLRQKKIPNEKTIIETRISRDVKNYENLPPHVAVAKEMQKKGEKVGKGSVVAYIVVRGEGAIRDRAKLPGEVGEGDYDAEYYITRQVVPSVQKLLEVIGYDTSTLVENEQSRLQAFF